MARLSLFTDSLIQVHSARLDRLSRPKKDYSHSPESETFGRTQSHPVGHHQTGLIDRTQSHPVDQHKTKDVFARTQSHPVETQAVGSSPQTHSNHKQPRRSSGHGEKKDEEIHKPKPVSRLRMRLQKAVGQSRRVMLFRKAIDMSRLRTDLTSLQHDVDEARQKADDWLNRNAGEEDPVEHPGNSADPSMGVGLTVGKWPSRFSSSMGRRRRTSISGASVGVSDSIVHLEHDGDTDGHKPSFSRSNSIRCGSKSNGSFKILRQASAKMPKVLMSLMDALEPEVDDGELSPAVNRYLPGVGKKWLRCHHGVAERLSREGSGDDDLQHHPGEVRLWQAREGQENAAEENSLTQQI